jgi:hypothetical protein
LLNRESIDDWLPDCTENPFGDHKDSILINFPAKRLKGKPGQKMRDELKDDSPCKVEG